MTPEITAKALELTRGAATDADKMQAIYAFVSLKIRYVAVEFGVGRIQPHAAADVLKNSFGDCKDKAILLAALFSAAGLSSMPSLIGVGETLHPEVPSPLQFNHVITQVTVANAPTWLDPTMEVAPFGYLAPDERGRRSLLLPDTDAPSLVDTPRESSRPGRIGTRVDGTLDANGAFHAAGQLALSGDGEVIVRGLFHQTSQSQWPELAKGYLVQQFGGDISNLSVSSPEDTAHELQLSYTYARDNFSDWAHRQMVFPLPQLTLPNAPESTLTSTKTLLLGEIGDSHARVDISLPSTFEATLPGGKRTADISADSSVASYTLHVSIDQGRLHVERDLVTKKTEVAPEGLDEYRTFLTTVRAAPYYILLREAGWDWTSTSFPHYDWPTAGTAEVADLIARGIAAYGRRDFTTSRGLLAQATVLDPKNGEAWSMLGRTEWIAGDRPEGLDAMQHQIDVAPSPAAYKMLAAYLPVLSDAVLALWRKGIAAFPDDRDMPALLGEALVARHQYEEAAAILQPERDRRPGSPRLNLQLGLADMHLDRVDQGVAALRKATDLDSGSLTLFTVASALLEAHQQPALAKDYAERAVKQSEELTARVTLQNLDSNTLTNMAMLPACWDTLGQALIEEGDIEKGQSYVQAAWNLTQFGPFGRRLGGIAETQKDPAAAARLYADSVSGISVSPVAGVGSDPRQTGMPKLIALVPDPARRAELITAERAALRKAVTFVVPSVAGVSGTADFYVLLGPDGSVTATRMANGAEALRSVGERLLGLKMPFGVPDASAIMIVRRGQLTCAPDASPCQFVLVPENLVNVSPPAAAAN